MTPSLRLIVALVCLWASPMTAGLFGQPSSQQQSAYTRSLWRIGDGLPEDTVQAIAESREGALWIGTTGGLTRFDGSRIAAPAKLQPLLANSIFTLAIQPDGTLWAGTEGSGLLRLRNGQLMTYSVHQGLTDGFVRKVLEDHQGRLWVGTDDGLFVLNTTQPEAQLRRVDIGPIAPLAVHAIAEDHAGRIWVGGSRLIAFDPNGAETEFALPGAYSQNRVKSLLETRDGRIWVGTVGGLQYLDHGQFHTVPGIRATARTLLEATDGTLWIGTIGNGVWTLEPTHNADNLVHLSGQALLPSETVLFLFEDDQRQIWIGTQAGLVRLNRTPVGIVALPESGDPDFETISGDNRGDVWVAAQSLYLIHNGVAKPVIYTGLKNVKVRNVYRARDGALWIGTDGSGAYRVPSDAAAPADIRHFTAPSELTNNFIRGFLESRDGDIWIATDEGVSRIGPHGATKFTQANGLAFFSTRSLLQASDGTIWIGTDHGLSHWSGGHFTHDPATSALAEEKVWSILQDRTGALWFGTRDHGLFRYRNAHLDQFTVDRGLPSNSIYQLLQDHTGTFWLTGPNRIVSIPEAEMESSSRPDKPLSVQTYSMPFGAEGAQLYGGRQPAGYVAPDNTLWFPTSRGAARILPVTAQPQPAPKAAVDDLIEDGRSVPVFSSNDGPLKVAANVARLSFVFTAISLRPQGGVRFRYRLDGFDSAWIAAGVNREATYTNLKARPYTFRVQAFDTANPSTISEFDLPLVKAHVFYQTVWFYALCGTLAVVIAWTLYKVRVRTMRARFAAVLAERNRLAREMHDTVIQGCTSISALLEAMASREAIATRVGAETAYPESAPKDSLLHYARTQARTTIDEARQAIWNMRHEPENDVDLIAALQAVATQMAGNTEPSNTEPGPTDHDPHITFDHDIDRVPIGASIAHEILMTVREAVYNSIQHSGSPQVEIDLRTLGEDLEITVADRGCGFVITPEPAATEGHYGILGMRERIQRMGGQMELTSARGAGTTIKLKLRKLRATP